MLVCHSVQFFAYRNTRGTNQYLLFLKVCGKEKSFVPPSQLLSAFISKELLVLTSFPACPASPYLSLLTSFPSSRVTRLISLVG